MLGTTPLAPATSPVHTAVKSQYYDALVADLKGKDIDSINTAPTLTKIFKRLGINESVYKGTTVKDKQNKLKEILAQDGTATGKGLNFKDSHHAKMSGGALGHAVIQTVANKMINALKKHSPNNPAIAKFQKLKRDSNGFCQLRKCTI